ncbi:MAG: penicillin-binding protein activator [archaeon]
MKKSGVILGAIILLVIFGVLVFFTQTSPNAKFGLQNEKIKIGVVAPFSGNSAWFGQFIRNGVELAVDKLTSEEKSSLEIIWEDDKCESISAISAVQKLIFVDGVKYVIGPLCNESVIPTEKLFEENKVISLTAGQPNNKIANMGKYHFAYLPEIQYVMKQLAQYAYSKWDRKIAILYIKGDYGYENYFYFKKYFTELGGEVVAEELTNIDSTDAKIQLTKIKSANPDSILLATHGASLINALTQMEVLGLNKIDRYGINAFETPQVLASVPDLAEGVVYPTPADSSMPNSVNEYSANYMKKYGVVKDIYSANAFDSFNILYSAIKFCSKDSDCVLTKISTIKNYAGANGILNIDERGVGYYPKYTLKTVKDGNFVTLN